MPLPGGEGRDYSLSRMCLDLCSGLMVWGFIVCRTTLNEQGATLGRWDGVRLPPAMPVAVWSSPAFDLMIKDKSPRSNFVMDQGSDLRVPNTSVLEVGTEICVRDRTDQWVTNTQMFSQLNRQQLAPDYHVDVKPIITSYSTLTISSLPNADLGLASLGGGRSLCLSGPGASRQNPRQDCSRETATNEGQFLLTSGNVRTAQGVPDMTSDAGAKPEEDVALTREFTQPTTSQPRLEPGSWVGQANTDMSNKRRLRMEILKRNPCVKPEFKEETQEKVSRPMLLKKHEKGFFFWCYFGC